jgi:hypothetical protein
MMAAVKRLNGSEICHLQNLSDNHTISDLKLQIEALTGMSSLSMKLGLNGKLNTQDSQPISVYKWRPGNTIVLLAGGAGKTMQAQREEMECGRISFPEYGYLQSNGDWVRLPKGTKVLSYPHDFLVEAGVNETKQFQYGCNQIECVDQRYTSISDSFHQSLTSNATAVKSSDLKRVHFCDGVEPGSDECQRNPHSNQLFAEWIFVDREVCGRSLFGDTQGVIAVGDNDS